jgi:hypothetical protein
MGELRTGYDWMLANLVQGVDDPMLESGEREKGIEEYRAQLEAEHVMRGDGEELRRLAE